MKAEQVNVQLGWVEKLRVPYTGEAMQSSRSGLESSVGPDQSRLSCCGRGSLRGAGGGSLGGPAWDHQWGGHRTLRTFQRSDIEDQVDHRRSLFQLSSFQIGKM